MSTKNENPYREGSQYHKLFGAWKKKQIMTRNELLNIAQTDFGLSREAAAATVTVLFSPRLSSKRGDCRGNMSSQGHLYFAERFAKKDGEYRFRLRWRKESLEPFKRSVKEPVQNVQNVQSEPDKAC
jgi:hypothetical protein